MKFSKKKQGFTLIELLVVVAIIGVLATVVLANLSAARGRAKDQLIRSHFNQLRTALELYYLDNNSYPDSSTLSTAWCSDSGNFGGTNCSATSGLNGWIPGLAPDYIPVLRSDLVAGNTSATWMYQGGPGGYKVMLHGTPLILSQDVPANDSMRDDNVRTGGRSYALSICINDSFCRL